MPPALVLLSPCAMRLVDGGKEDFGPQRAQRSRAVIEAYRQMAAEEGVEFVSLADIPTSEDGIHFDIETLAAIGDLVTEAVAKVLGCSAAPCAPRPNAEPEPGPTNRAGARRRPAPPPRGGPRERRP